MYVNIYFCYISFLILLMQGLLDVVRSQLPMAEHRCCVRHLYANLRKKHKNKDLQKQFWLCAKSYNMPNFEANVKEMKRLSPQGYEDILNCHPSH